MFLLCKKTCAQILWKQLMNFFNVMHIIPNIVFVIQCKIFLQKGFLQLVRRNNEVEKRRRKKKNCTSKPVFSNFFTRTVTFEN